MIRLLILSMILALPAIVYADECFDSSRQVNVDAQTIRQKALDLGWIVGKTASLSAASVIMGKVGLYPKNDVEICLRENNGNKLEIRAQSKAKDAGQAGWHNLHGKRK